MKRFCLCLIGRILCIRSLVVPYYIPGYEDHTKTQDLEIYSGQHKMKDNKGDVRPVPPNQLSIPSSKDPYKDSLVSQHRHQGRHPSDVSIASFQNSRNGNEMTPEYGASQEDARASSYHRSRRVHPQQSSNHDQYRRYIQSIADMPRNTRSTKCLGDVNQYYIKLDVINFI